MYLSIFNCYAYDNIKNIVGLLLSITLAGLATYKKGDILLFTVHDSFIDGILFFFDSEINL